MTKAKKPYTPPKLKVHGDVETLTQVAQAAEGRLDFDYSATTPREQFTFTG